MKILPAVFLAGSVAGSVAVAALGARERIGAYEFTLPDGFRIGRVAATNDIPRPVNGALDDRGRLYVTDSSGSTDDPAAQHRDPRWRVIRLEDADGDGRYEKATIFADRLPMLQGVLWHGGAVYVGGAPSIWKLTDTDGDGRADRREEWWNTGHATTHCGNEVHGPYAGPDGFLYWTKGAFEPVGWTNAATGRAHRDRAAHIFRARPDGSGLEAVMTGGMDNPVDVAFTADGEALFTSTFIDFSGPGWRDGVAHATYGAVFGKENAVLDDRTVVRAGPALAHPVVQWGAAAPSGLAAYHHDAFGPGYYGNLFAAAFNLRSVGRVVLEREGSTYRATLSDFVVADALDFHPTDVIADADGSLLILDTGGWYKLCCPSSQLYKADVLGGVYRVTREGGAHRRRDAAPRETAAARLRRLVDVRDPSARDLATEMLDAALKTRDAAAQLSAVTAVARLRHAPAAARLVEVLAGGPDEPLRMAATAALVELDAPGPVRDALSHAAPVVVAAALQSLDQMPSGRLSAAETAPHLFSPDETVRGAALWVAGRRPEWGDALAGLLRERLAAPSKGLPAARELLVALAGSRPVQELLAELAGADAADAGLRLAALEAMREAAPKAPPATWSGAVARCLGKADARVVAAAVAVAGGPVSGPETAGALLGLARAEERPEAARLAAFSALPEGWEPTAKDFDFLAAVFTRGEAAAADALGRALLSTAQAIRLAGLAGSATPLGLGRLLPAFEKRRDAAVTDALLGALETAKARTSVRPDQLRAVLKGHSGAARERGEKFLDGLGEGSAAQRAKLAEIAESLPKGDVRRGQAVFNSPKAACIQCHRLGYQGGDVGPDLTSIGTVRGAQDLLEAVVFPSASFVRSYEPVTVVTRRGEERLGILRRDDARGVSLVTGPGTKLEIAREEIAEVLPATVSLMPSGLDEQLGRQELADLMAFLANTRWGRN